jgi:hypothetical protein
MHTVAPGARLVRSFLWIRAAPRTAVVGEHAQASFSGPRAAPKNGSNPSQRASVARKIIKPIKSSHPNPRLHVLESWLLWPKNLAPAHQRAGRDSKSRNPCNCAFNPAPKPRLGDRQSGGGKPTRLRAKAKLRAKANSKLAVL